MTDISLQAQNRLGSIVIFNATLTGRGQNVKILPSCKELVELINVYCIIRNTTTAVMLL